MPSSHGTFPGCVCPARHGKDKARMSNKTANSFIVPPLIEYAEFYQQLLRGIGNYEQLGNRLIHLGEQAHAFRQFDKVKECGQILSNIPIRDYQAIGYYFLAVAANSKGNGDQDEARKLSELAVDTAPTHYKAKALLSLAAVSANTNNRDLEMYYYLETIKAGKISVATVEALRGIAIYKAIEGYHDKAVKDLEGILPIIKFVPTHIYYDYLNSYAVELGEVGRKSEARNISRIVLSSPFAYAYPEWQDTANDLRGSQRSFVAFSPSKFIPHNVLAMPAIEHGEIGESSYNQPARVLDLQKWKKKMAKGKRDNGEQFDENVDEMDDKDLLATLIQLTAKDDVDEEKLRLIVKYAIKVLSQPYKPEPDDTDGA